MNTDLKYFPHPVLGISDDVEGVMHLQIETERNLENKSIVFRIIENEIVNDYFKDLIKQGKASVLFKVYCSSTFKTFNFLNVADSFEIDEREICNKVEIEPYIISTQINKEYADATFNPEYESQVFEVNKYDIIGLLGRLTVAIDQKYEKLGIGNLFVFEANEDETKPLSFDLTLNKIHIKYPPTKDGEHPPNAMFHKNPWAAFNIFIVPALNEAFKILLDPVKATDVSDLEWCDVLNDLLPETERSTDSFSNAQLILNKEMPVLKAYEELIKN